MASTVLRELDLHITNRCNLRCPICCFDSGNLTQPELSTKEFINAIDQAKELGCQEVHLTGGEPLLRSDSIALVQYVCTKGLHLRLQTNGTHLTLNTCKELSFAGLKEIMISLDSHREDICDTMRGAGAHRNAIAAIQNAVSEGIRVRVNAVATSVNRTSLPDILPFLHGIGVSTFSLFYFSPVGRGAGSSDLWLSPGQYLSLTGQINDYLVEHPEVGRDIDVITEKGYASWNEAFSISSTGFTGSGGGCAKALESRDYLILRCDGEVYPCIMLLCTGTSLGNIMDKPLEYIHSSSLGWSQLSREKATSGCGGCVHAAVCHSGCAGYAKIFTGDGANSDPRCVPGEIVPLCPIMKYNHLSGRLGGSSSDVTRRSA